MASLTLLAVPMSVVIAAGCAGAKTTDAVASPTANAGDDGGADADAAPAHPFAGSASEATQLIEAAVDQKSSGVQKCIDEYRKRKKLPRERVSIQLGIDQEGRLLGATLPKGKTDEVLTDCVQNALVGAPFPRSHTGVISITKSYEEIAQ